LANGPAGRIGRVVVLHNFLGFLNRVAGEFRCLLASFWVGGGFLGYVIYDLAEYRHRSTLTNMSGSRQPNYDRQSPNGGSAFGSAAAFGGICRYARFIGNGTSRTGSKVMNLSLLGLAGVNRYGARHRAWGQMNKGRVI
jgi:hypothetical protein